MCNLDSIIRTHFKYNWFAFWQFHYGFYTLNCINYDLCKLFYCLSYNIIKLSIAHGAQFVNNIVILFIYNIYLYILLCIVQNIFTKYFDSYLHRKSIRGQSSFNLQDILLGSFNFVGYIFFIG